MLNHQLDMSTSVDTANVEGENDEGVLIFIYHEGTEEVECGNCRSKVGIDNLADMEWISDCKEHNDHDCEMKQSYTRIRFTGCGNSCSACKTANLEFHSTTTTSSP